MQTFGGSAETLVAATAQLVLTSTPDESFAQELMKFCREVICLLFQKIAFTDACCNFRPIKVNPNSGDFETTLSGMRDLIRNGILPVKILGFEHNLTEVQELDAQLQEGCLETLDHLSIRTVVAMTAFST